MIIIHSLSIVHNERRVSSPFDADTHTHTHTVQSPLATY